MDASVPENFDRNAAKAITSLVEEVISHPERRRSFAKDPDRAAADAGVDISVIPDSVITTLSDMQVAELELLADLVQKLQAEGLVIEIDGMKTCVFL